MYFYIYKREVVYYQRSGHIFVTLFRDKTESRSLVKVQKVIEQNGSNFKEPINNVSCTEHCTSKNPLARFQGACFIRKS